jgi:hypothetical protein
LRSGSFRELERFFFSQFWCGSPDAATYTSIAHSIFDHAERHGFPADYLKYLRKAHNFNRKRAKQKILSDGSIRWHKGIEFLIERNGKIVSYGEN